MHKVLPASCAASLSRGYVQRSRGAQPCKVSHRVGLSRRNHRGKEASDYFSVFLRHEVRHGTRARARLIDTVARARLTESAALKISLRKNDICGITRARACARSNKGTNKSPLCRDRLNRHDC